MITSVCGDMKKSELLCIFGRNVSGHRHYRKQCGGSPKIKSRTVIGSDNPTSGYLHNSIDGTGEHYAK